MKKSKRKIEMYAYGTNPEGVSGKTMGAGYGTIAQAVPQIADGIIDILENNPNKFSKQPLVNTSAMRNMVSPYAYGGIVEDTKPKKRKDNTSTVNTTYGTNGIVGKKGKPTEQEALINTTQYLKNNWSDQSDTPSNVYRPEFQPVIGDPMKMLPIAAMGGMVGNSNVEAEGGETVETPGGELSEVQGPSHESGGVDLNLPEGTKIFSDRLTIDGKTMSDRKKSRERRLARINNLLEKNPNDKILKNTVNRTQANSDVEEHNDMMIQKVAGQLYHAPIASSNKNTKSVAAYGTIVGPDDPYYFGSNFTDPTLNKATIPPYRTGYEPMTANPAYASPTTPTTLRSSGLTSPAIADLPTTSKSNSNKSMGLTAGDYVGMGGTLFNAIAPIINTNKNAAYTRPHRNEFRGFGHAALETNDVAQSYIDNQRSHSLTDIETESNAAISRNRNSSDSVNVDRALNIATSMAKNRAKASVDTEFSNKMLSLLGQRGQIQNEKDNAEMSGEERANDKNERSTDNYFSNMSENLVNAGTNIQGIGKTLNTNKSNNVDTRLLGELSRYGLSFDKDGNLISTDK